MTGRIKRDILGSTGMMRRGFCRLKIDGKADNTDAKPGV